MSTGNALSAWLKVRDLPQHAVCTTVALAALDTETARRILEAVRDRFWSLFPERVFLVDVSVQASATVFQMPGDPERGTGASGGCLVDVGGGRKKRKHRKH